MANNADAFKCETCQWGRHCDERNPAPFAKWVIKGVIESKTCLLPMITAQSSYLLRMHGHYKNRVLPYAGGILEQPNYFIEMMEHIDARDNALRAEQAQRERERMVRTARGYHAEVT